MRLSKSSKLCSNAANCAAVLQDHRHCQQMIAQSYSRAPASGPVRTSKYIGSCSDKPSALYRYARRATCRIRGRLAHMQQCSKIILSSLTAATTGVSVGSSSQQLCSRHFCSTVPNPLGLKHLSLSDLIPPLVSYFILYGHDIPFLKV